MEGISQLLKPYKVCNGCSPDIGLPVVAFSRRPERRIGVASKCRRCKAERTRKLDGSPAGRAASRARKLKSYGITPAEYDEMFTAQGGVCAVCRQPETQVDPRTGEVRPLSVDHCHETGKVRGLLCANHNVALGLFADNPDDLLSAATYLRGIFPPAPGADRQMVNIQEAPEA